MTAEQEILSAYGENPNGIYSINEISRRIGKAYPNVHKTVQTLVHKGILKRHPMGRSHLCSVNLEDNRAILLLALNHAHKQETLPEHIKQQLIQLAPHKQQIDAIIYHEPQETLLVITEHELEHPTITTKQLHQQLLEDETLYTQHTIITGYEYFFALLTSPDITRRYHPLL